ncbi:MAG: hypothetical protein ABJC63_08265 [Gemmatimonadales bacterium]
MRSYFVLALAIAASACKIESTTTAEPPVTFHVTATISGNNTCAVNALDKNLSSIGQIKGDTPSKFIGTLDKNYHGISCWVSADGGVTTASGDAFFNVIFSGNNLDKPLAVGRYGLRFEILDSTPKLMATVRFGSSSIGGDELRPLDDAQGSVTVDSTANGTRTIHVDLQAIRYHRGF